MNALIKSATVIDAQSTYHGKTVDIRIKNGTISEIGTTLTATKAEKTIEKENLHISQGWFDSSVSMGQPGYEERETIENGLHVAAASGFTGVAVNANTHPVLDTRATVAYVHKMAEGFVSSAFVIGALSRKSEGKDLAELYDMQQGGAVAFGDYQKAIANPNLLKIALQYAQGFDGLVLSYPQEDALVGKGIVNEGEVSTRLGLKGSPSLAESVHIARDLHILEYTGGKLHIPTISTAAAVVLVRDAKAKGLDVSCSVAITNLFYTDAVLEQFDTHYKVLPPLRTAHDQDALITGIKDGTIDMVTSDHNPLDIEKKKVEFDNAVYGTTAQEATFGALLTLVSKKKAVKLLTNARTRFTATSHVIAEGNEANLTLFDTKGSFSFRESDILSKSKNAAFISAKLKGKVYGVVANNKLHLN